MALQEFVGAIVMEVDGREIEVVSVNPTVSTGRRLVRTMNRSGNAAGFSRGVTNYDLRVTAVVPRDGEPLDWENIEGAKITLAPIAGGKRVSYLDCFSTQVGRQYEVDNEARVDIQMNALRKVEE
ncbi:MAG: phage tail protein [Rubrivivax sp.]